MKKRFLIVMLLISLLMVCCSHLHYVEHNKKFYFVFDSKQRVFVNYDYDSQISDTMIYEPFVSCMPVLKDEEYHSGSMGPLSGDVIGGVYDFKFYSVYYNLNNGQKHYVLIRQIGNNTNLNNHWNIKNISESEVNETNCDYEEFAFRILNSLDRGLPSIDSLYHEGKGIILAQNENFKAYLLNVDKKHKKKYINGLKGLHVLDSSTLKKLQDRGVVDYQKFKKAYNFLTDSLSLKLLDELVSPPFYLFNDTQIVRGITKYSLSSNIHSLDIKEIVDEDSETNSYVSFSKLYGNTLYAICGTKFKKSIPKTIYDTNISKAFKLIFNKKGNLVKVESVFVYYQVTPTHVREYEHCP